MGSLERKLKRKDKLQERKKQMKELKKLSPEQIQQLREMTTQLLEDAKKDFLKDKEN